MPSDSPTSQADAMLAANAEYAASSHDPDLGSEPTLRVAVVTCMDSRIDIMAILGLNNGEAHCIRNAGGVVTDDVIRSLCLSQRSLGTREIVLAHHTDCGLQKVQEESFRSELEAETGITPEWSVDAFDDPYVDVQQSMQRLRSTPFVPHTEAMRGFVYNVVTGRLEEVEG